MTQTVNVVPWAVSLTVSLMEQPEQPSYKRHTFSLRIHPALAVRLKLFLRAESDKHRRRVSAREVIEHSLSRYLDDRDGRK